VVALAGHRHVVVAVEPQLARPAGGTGGERGDHRPLRRLRLLAAEAAAHAPDLAGDESVGDAERARHDVLHLARMLGGGMDEHVAVLPRHGERGLTLEIEMLLPADAQRALEAMAGAGERRLHVAAAEGL